VAVVCAVAFVAILKSRYRILFYRPTPYRITQRTNANRFGSNGTNAPDSDMVRKNLTKPESQAILPCVHEASVVEGKTVRSVF